MAAVQPGGPRHAAQHRHAHARHAAAGAAASCGVPCGGLCGTGRARDCFWLNMAESGTCGGRPLRPNGRLQLLGLPRGRTLLKIGSHPAQDRIPTLPLAPSSCLPAQVEKLQEADQEMLEGRGPGLSQVGSLGRGLGGGHFWGLVMWGTRDLAVGGHAQAACLPQPQGQALPPQCTTL